MANVFNTMEIDAIGEIMNISLGASATAVSTLLGGKVNITTPTVLVQNRDEFEFKELEPAIGVEISYIEGLDGTNVMMFSRNDVRIIVGMMMGMEIPEDSFEMDEINSSAIREVMNQMMGSSATALSEFLGTTVNISTPISYEIENENAFKDKYFEAMEPRVVVRFALEIEGKLTSQFLNIMSVELVKRLLKPFQEQFGLLGEAAEEAAVPEEPAVAETERTEQEESPELLQNPESDVSKPLDQSAADAMLAGLLAEQDSASSASEEETAEGPVSKQPETEASEPAFSQAMPETAAAAIPQPALHTMAQSIPQPTPQPYMPMQADPLTMQLLTQMQQSQTQMLELIRDMRDSGTKREEKPREANLVKPLNSREFAGDREEREENADNREMLMKVPLEISVEIGRTRKLVKDILEFTQGSLVVLDKMAGEQADLFVNGECIARGDIVVVEDNFGIRITEILKKDINQESL